MNEFREKGMPITLPARPEVVDVRGEQPYLFPFDAFEFDDPRKQTTPILRMKAPWSLAADAKGVQIRTDASLLKRQADASWLPATILAEAVLAVGGTSTYQWGYADSSGVFHAIVGATSSSYVVHPTTTPGWDGVILRLALIVTNDLGVHSDVLIITKTYDDEALSDAATAQNAADAAALAALEASIIITRTVSVLMRDRAGAYTPTTITFSATANGTPYNGRWIIKEQAANLTWTEVYRSTSDESSYEHTPSAGIIDVRADICVVEA